MKKAVFSDLDGTLAKGFLTVDFIRWLAKKGVLKKEPFALHEKLMREYKEGKTKYIDLVPKWSQSVAECFAGIEEKALKRLAGEFFKEWEKNIFPSTKPLVSLLHEHGYRFFLISAGWDYLVEKTSEEINADGFRAMKITVENGKFLPILGNELFSEKGKGREIKKIIRELKIAKTMGFGDSIKDAAIFKSVKKPVALNPSEELLEKAKKENWYIADHKNVLEIMQKCFAKEKKSPARGKN